MGAIMGNFLFDVIQSMVVHKVDFVLCGGLACVLHGSERTTFDIDIHIRMDEDNILHLIEFARSHGLKPRIPEPLENLMIAEKRNTWKREKGALVYTLTSTDGIVQLDVFLDYPIPYDKLVERAILFEAEGVSFPVSSMEDMLAVKEAISEKRPQDYQDIAFLKEKLEHENK